MQIYKEKSLCTGCSACVNICPKACIQMQEDERGFLYPVVDSAACIQCNRCKSVCSTYLEKNNSKVESQLYSYTNPSLEVLKRSSSGGIFTTISEKILNMGGYVCGAVYGDDFSVHHTVSSDPVRVSDMCGSKYVQSDMGNCFQTVRKILTDQKKPILFTGTPCQCLGLRKYLGKEYENLYIADIVCHSVPSPKVFRAYIESLEEKYGKISGINFRDKRNGWLNYSCVFEFENGTVCEDHNRNLYMSGVLDGFYHRESCEQCPVKTVTGYCSDLTMGDFWGIKSVAPDAYRQAGVSAVIVHNLKGKILLEGSNIKEYEMAPFLVANPKINSCISGNRASGLFYKNMVRRGINEAFTAVYRKPLMVQIKMFLKKLIHTDKRG